MATALAAQQPYVVATIPAFSATRHSAGAALARAGDVDLDGSQDLLVGFPYSGNEANEATNDQIPFPLYTGASGFQVWSPLTGAFIRTITEPGYATRGFAVVNLGDINGDGKPDAAVSNPTFTQPGANWVGRVDAYSGADGSVLWSFISGVAAGQAGVSMSRIADVDLDGKPDVLVGAVGMNGIAGRVFVLSAQTGAVLRTHVGVTGDALGYATSDAGDVDGDGTPDYAAGAPQSYVAGATQPAGYVRLWSGATGAVIRTVTGFASFDRFGRSLAPAGDLNGDGVADLYVGAPARFNQAAAGRVYALSGANGSVILNLTRNVAGDRFGWSLAAVGDRNGDGKVDVAAGTTVGVVEVRSGAFGGVLFVQNGIPGQTVSSPIGQVMRPFAVGDVDGDLLIDVAIGSANTGENGVLVLFTSSGVQPTLAGDNSQSAVSSIAALGDLDGDGIRDLAISNTKANSTSANDAGQVMIRSSATGATVATLSGTTPFEYFGWSVSTLDDVNNDGVEDFLVSSNSTTAGKVTCYSGANGAPLYSVAGTTPGGFFGYSIARLSDLNGDGIRDFAAGAPYSTIGGVATTGQVHVCSGANGAILMTINGLAGGEFFGNPIAEIGDLDGDSVPDFIVGAAYASPGGVGQAGVARIISGATGQILRTHSGTAQGIALGNALCGAGDVDLDGVADYAIASPANTASGSPAGPVVVYSGATGLVIRSLPPSPIPAGFSVNDTFGLGLSNAGDLDGDGFADLVLGLAPWLGFPPVQAREIHAYSGANGALISKQVASPGFTPLAPSRAATGFDLDGDGAPDWAAFGYSQTVTAAPVTIVSRAGLPQGVTSTGTGCNLAAPLAPVLQTGGGGIVAAAGSPVFELLVSRASPNQSGLLVIGASNTSWAGTPLPLDLTVAGLPSCFLHNSVDTLIPFVTTPAGLWGLPVPISANPALAGTTAYAQAFLVGAASIASSTNGLALVVQ